MHRYSDDVDAWYPHNTQAYDDAAWRNSVFGFENKTAVAIAYIANDSWVAPGVLGHTALSEVCKYGAVHSQMHGFSRHLRRLSLFCKATGHLSVHMIIYG